MLLDMLKCTYSKGYRGHTPRFSRSTDFSFEVTYRHIFRDERTMPLTLNVEPYLYSAINNQTYINPNPA